MGGSQSPKLPDGHGIIAAASSGNDGLSISKNEHMCSKTKRLIFRYNYVVV